MKRHRNPRIQGTKEYGTRQVLDKAADGIVVDAGAQGAEEVDRLPRELVHQRLHVIPPQVVVLRGGWRGRGGSQSVPHISFAYGKSLNSVPSAVHVLLSKKTSQNSKATGSMTRECKIRCGLCGQVYPSANTRAILF